MNYKINSYSKGDVLLENSSFNLTSLESSSKRDIINNQFGVITF